LRLSRADLSVLRLATFELLARPQIPASVTLNEAIEIARRYGSEDSPAFVNGVLDHIAGVLGVRRRGGRPARCGAGGGVWSRGWPPAAAITWPAAGPPFRRARRR